MLNHNSANPYTTLSILFLLILFTFNNSHAQTVTGQISGTITNPTGAAPGVSVTATNLATGLTRTVKSNEDGFYVITNLPVGEYTVYAEQDGFKRSSRTGIQLVADGRITIDFNMEVGVISVEVAVSMLAGESVNRTSGELARVIDKEQVQNLALNTRNYVQLLSLIPGTTVLNQDQAALTTSYRIDQSINGNRGNSHNQTIDGGFNLDAGSNSSYINTVGIDFIHEVKIQTSNFSAEYGRQSGVAINVVTQNGSNKFHGRVFEFIRNDKLDARPVFAPERSKIRYNNFGWNLGGPIIKDKLFFFGGMEWKKIRVNAVQRQAFPTRAERAGIFGGRIGDISSRITPNGRAIANLYNIMEGQAVSYTESLNARGQMVGWATFQLPNPFDFRQDVLRLDYNLDDSQYLYLRYIHDNHNLIAPFGPFAESNVPTIPSNRQRPSHGIQLSHVWAINPKIVNEAKVSTSWHGQRIPPVGDAWKRETYGFTFPQLFSTGGPYTNGIPNVDISGYANFRGPSISLIAPATDVSLSDNLTYNLGNHTIKTGGIFIRNRKDQNGRANYTGWASFNPSGNPNSVGNAFADALLGNFRTYSEASDDPLGFFRFSQFEAYVSDNWRVKRNLSFEFGLRYYYIPPIHTQANNWATFDPALYNPADAVTVLANGKIDTSRGGNRFNGLIRAGDGVPEEELGRVSNGNSSIVNMIPSGARRGFLETAHRVAPRFSFAWSPFEGQSTTIRGGFGMYFNRPEHDAFITSLNNPPYLIVSEFDNGNLENPSGGASLLAAPLRLEAIDSNMEVPYSMNWSLSVQHELPKGIFVEAAYVSNLGRHLIHQPDINQPRYEDIAANPSANINTLRPYKGYSEIRMRVGDANSNYQALQLYVAKRKGDVFFTGSYTWSKALTHASHRTDDTKDIYDRHLAYGPANFDRRHVFASTYTYIIPFFRGTKGVTNKILNGWEISGITRFQSGGYLTVVGTSSIGRRRADYIDGDVNLSSGERTVARWFNTDAFRQAPNWRPGTSGVGIVEGPGLQLWDFSLRKRFAITERVDLRFQVDFFNIFNRANFGDPIVDVNNPAFGQITSAGPGRNIQLGMKLIF
jgi:hypothetical protein